MSRQQWWDDNEKERTQLLGEKNCSSYTSAIINPTRTGLGLKLDTCVDGRRQTALSIVSVMEWKTNSCLIKSRLMNTFNPYRTNVENRVSS